MLFRHLYNHDLAQASYLVGCSATGQALVVEDAGYLAGVGPRLTRFFIDRGVLLRPLGNTIYVMPPYCITGAELDAAVKDANKAVSQAEAIKKFRVLAADFTEDNGMLTPSLKLKRSVVMKEFDSEVEGLYAR